METLELKLRTAEPHSDEQVSALNQLLGALRMNGQILGAQFPMAQTAAGYSVFLSAPERSSLDSTHANKYVRRSHEHLVTLGIDDTEVIHRGPEPESFPLCTCATRSFYLLYTTYLSLESPMHCGDCFGIVPLYWLPSTADHGYYDIICWEHDYQACDQLQMNCQTGERFGTREIFNVDSSLTIRGMEICASLSALTRTKVYYYLYRNNGRSVQQEHKRTCPKCQGEWRLPEALHERFDFKCDACGLLSNIAWNVRASANC
jgi:predicted  nucleic acid-binding Zn ribbon protein